MAVTWAWALNHQDSRIDLERWKNAKATESLSWWQEVEEGHPHTGIAQGGCPRPVGDSTASRKGSDNRISLLEPPSWELNYLVFFSDLKFFSFYQNTSQLQRKCCSKNNLISSHLTQTLLSLSFILFPSNHLLLFYRRDIFNGKKKWK